ncbi:MAG: energy transducer TonB [Candidatus Omnitrophota bacterium]
MLEDKLISAAFLISFSGHCLLLGVPGFNQRLPLEIKKVEDMHDIKISFEKDRPALLPKIDTMGEEKKFKKVEQKPEPPRPELKPQPLSEQAAVQQTPQERIEEKLEVNSLDKEAMLRYQDMVKQRIEEVRRYPLWAKKQGVEGITYLYFIILPNGIAKDVRVVASSGSKILDEEAVATVKRATPFHPVPQEISRSSVSMTVAIVFSLSKK